jgi:hypothetical protein
MPSIWALLASVVRQVSTTWSPAETTVGVAVICAVGAGTTTGGGGAGGGGTTFFLQPATVTRAKSNATGTRMRLRVFNVWLLPQIQKLLPRDRTINNHPSGPQFPNGEE